MLCRCIFHSFNLYFCQLSVLSPSSQGTDMLMYLSFSPPLFLLTIYLVSVISSHWYVGFIQRNLHPNTLTSPKHSHTKRRASYTLHPTHLDVHNLYRPAPHTSPTPLLMKTIDQCSTLSLTLLSLSLSLGWALTSGPENAVPATAFLAWQKRDIEREGYVYQCTRWIVIVVTISLTWLAPRVTTWIIMSHLD